MVGGPIDSSPRFAMVKGLRRNYYTPQFLPATIRTLTPVNARWVKLEVFEVGKFSNLAGPGLSWFRADSERVPWMKVLRR